MCHPRWTVAPEDLAAATARAATKNPAAGPAGETHNVGAVTGREARDRQTTPTVQHDVRIMAEFVDQDRAEADSDPDTLGGGGCSPPRIQDDEPKPELHGHIRAQQPKAPFQGTALGTIAKRRHAEAVRSS